MRKDYIAVRERLVQLGAGGHAKKRNAASNPKVTGGD